MPESDQEQSYHSASGLRDANRALLDTLADLDGAALSSEFLDRIEAFRARAAATGAYLSANEDRAEAQSVVNFWLTVLFNHGRTPVPILVADFDSKSALKRAGDVAPYKGLDPFEVEDSGSFFGRHRAISTMLAVLADHRLMAVTGLSGSGKSSAVRAGLIPRLRDGAIGGSGEWLIPDPIVPGESPLAALGAILRLLIRDPPPIAAAADLTAALDVAGRPVLISIDQFEELFTIAAPDQRELFLDALVDAATQGKYPHIVLITMRSEFDTDVEEHVAFSKLFNAGRVPIAALSAQELRAAIEQPAAQVGVRFESGLVDDLVQSAVGEPAGLPLLQFALLALWNRRSKTNLIELDAYRELGGSPREILARSAAHIYNGQLAEDQKLTRDIFLALVQIGAGLAATSRRIRRSQLEGPRDNVNRVLNIWRDNGLLRISPPGQIAVDSQIEVAHEAVIRNWDQLVEWIRERFKPARRRGVLTELAIAWQEDPSRTDLLLGEISLRDSDQLRDLNDDEQKYVAASRKAVDRARRMLRRRIQLAFGAALVGLLLLGGGITQAIRAAQATTLSQKSAREAVAAKAESQALITEGRARRLAFLRSSERLRTETDSSLRQAAEELQRIRAAEQTADRNFRNLSVRFAATTRQHASMVTATQTMRGQLEQMTTESTRRNTEAREVQSFARDLLRTLTEYRPTLVLANNNLGSAPATWMRLQGQRHRIDNLATGVGRVLDASGSFRGSTFLVAEGVAVITRIHLNRGSAEIGPGDVAGLMVDFRSQPTSDLGHAFRIESIVAVMRSGDNGSNGSNGSNGDDLILVRVQGHNTLGEALPNSLELGQVGLGEDTGQPPLDKEAPDLGALYPGRALYIIGFPMRDARLPTVLTDAIFAGPDGVKRLSPGYLFNVSGANGAIHLEYDNRTSRGNVGSPVVDLETGLVLGVHLGGQEGLKFAVAFTPELLQTPLARSAGLRARQVLKRQGE